MEYVLDQKKFFRIIAEEFYRNAYTKNLDFLSISDKLEKFKSNVLKCKNKILFIAGLCNGR